MSEQPPDVALISWQWNSRSGGRALALRCARDYDDHYWQTQTFGPIEDRYVTDVQPARWRVVDPSPDTAADRSET